MQYFLKTKTQHPKISTMDYPKFIVSNQKEESISIQRVKGYAIKPKSGVSIEIVEFIIL